MNDSGKKYEKLIEKALNNNSKWAFRTQHDIGKKPNGKTKHTVDIFLTEINEVVSLKYQNSGGTAGDKVPYEVRILQEAIEQGNCDSAVLVLHGNGFSAGDKEWFLSEGFCAKQNCPDVRIMEHGDFLREYTNISEKTLLEEYTKLVDEKKGETPIEKMMK